MTESVTLGYWNIRGLAERIRLVLEYLKIPYNQNIFTPETQDEWFSKVKPQYLKKNPAANLPFLLDGEKLICQSEAIIVYLCLKADRKDLLGEGADEQALIATVMGVFKDLSKTFSGFCYGDRPYEQFKAEAINSLKPGLDKLKGLLGDKQWFTGKLSYCDFVLGDFFQVQSLFNQNFATQYPTLKALQERLWQLQGINTYLKSDKFKERPISWYPEAKWY